MLKLKSKGMVDTVVLLVFAAVLLATFFIFMQINSVIGIVKIKGEIDIYLDIEDQGTETLAFLSTKKSDINYMGVLGSYAASNVPKKIEDDLKATLLKFERYNLVVQGPNGVVKEIKSANQPTSTVGLEYDVKLAWPVKDYNTISSGYGYRQLSSKGTDFHGGLDFAIAKGTSVYSTYSSGKVVRIGKNCKSSDPVKCEKITSCSGNSDTCCCNGGLGNFVVIEHTSDKGKIFYTHYDHLDTVNVKLGDILGKEINPKTPIGTSGNTGYVLGKTGEHLHFEMNSDKYKNDKTSINPCNYFNEPVPSTCGQSSTKSPSLSVVIPMPNGKVGNVGLLT
ncbi:MAG: M23 family metallopeptidase [Candidatus Aenigmarchaeota archaeon]|nr:M23 family metallopeptidase [Candidatus Aenigmarchaeota archaeon]